MKNKLLLGLVSLLLLSGCSISIGNSTEAEIKNAKLSYAANSDNEAIEEATIFSKEAPEIYVSGEVTIKEVPSTIVCKWFYEGEEATNLAYELELNNSDSTFQFAIMANEEGWPIGNYRVDITYDEKVLFSKDFSVRDDSLLLKKVFYTEDMGTLFEYPLDWTYEYISDTSVILYEITGPDEHYSQVSLSNYTDTSFEVMYNLYIDHTESLGGLIDEYELSTYNSNSKEFDYIRFSREYIHENVEYNEWVYVIKRDEEIYHELVYRSPKSLFDGDTSNFDIIADSLIIVE